jgi:hypothetical protein
LQQSFANKEEKVKLFYQLINNGQNPNKIVDFQGTFGNYDIIPNLLEASPQKGSIEKQEIEKIQNNDSNFSNIKIDNENNNNIINKNTFSNTHKNNLINNKIYNNSLYNTQKN